MQAGKVIIRQATNKSYSTKIFNRYVYIYIRVKVQITHLIQYGCSKNFHRDYNYTSKQSITHQKQLHCQLVQRGLEIQMVQSATLRERESDQDQGRLTMARWVTPWTKDWVGLCISILTSARKSRMVHTWHIVSSWSLVDNYGARTEVISAFSSSFYS